MMGGVRKNFNFGNEITEIPDAQNSCPGQVPEGGVLKREKTSGNQVDDIVGE